MNYEKELRVKLLNYLGVALLYDYKNILKETLLQSSKDFNR